MKNKVKQTVETQNKDDSKKYYDPPVHDDETFSDVKRKREEIKNSTIGGF